MSYFESEEYQRYLRQERRKRDKEQGFDGADLDGDDDERNKYSFTGEKLVEDDEDRRRKGSDN